MFGATLAQHTGATESRHRSNGLSSLALDGLGGGYHLYELVYDPASASADLFVDGVERLSNYAGNVAVNTPTAWWGSGGGPGTGQGNFAAASFNVSDVPEPGSAAIMGVVLATGALVRRKHLRARARG
jgi:hypothetical protein